jgi:hypothetical protein
LTSKDGPDPLIVADERGDGRAIKKAEVDHEIVAWLVTADGVDLHDPKPSRQARQRHSIRWHRVRLRDIRTLRRGLSPRSQPTEAPAGQ